MANKTTPIETLKKVALEITAGTGPDIMDLVSVPQTVEFVFGIASGGLTEFEYALAGKQAGDKGSIAFEAHNQSEIFGHILPCEVQSRLTAGKGYVRYRITGVSDTTPAEVVRSMAAAVGGCGDGCGCGCEGH
jgi:hypothetical protein